MRQIWCKKYSECLDKATVDNKPFTCQGCPYVNDETLKPQGPDLNSDLDMCIALLTAIFQPKLRHTKALDAKEMIRRKKKFTGYGMMNGV
ncbi:hypothetical protein HRM2_48040 [Desulforapulum autotrophicum HRM2]|uniref:Uncharacterized protein n=1 Tax=Desulforapulum autotrophicum (strain ATCC 43914 / DSM 3382 / VKM B-1955 / HRM2) TaxID=177437 RepID=C0QHJ4_DESAH|nr:hypothetical protein [Desulforapulum autotrophicum]ACN17853.1 hypothetical protein HRM2_48040 [Desulforapulum autotrophicum HRM2]